MRLRKFVGLGSTAPRPPVTGTQQPSARTLRLRLLGLLSTLAAFAVAPAVAQTFLTFHCADGTEFVMVVREGARSASVQLDGKAVTLPRRLSISGSRYSAGRIALRVKQNTATLSRGRRSTECSSS
jgi:membrane-bound inhibitor of C-type lysozyme